MYAQQRARPVVGREVLGRPPAVVAPTFEVRQRSGDFEQWGSEIRLYSPMVVMFRWGERIAGGSVSAKWILTDAPLGPSTTILASGSAGPAPAQGATTVFTIDFRDHLPPQPPPFKTYHLTLETIRANGQPGVRSAPILVKQLAPPAPTVFTRSGLSEPIDGFLEAVRAKHDLPALGAAIVTKTGIQVMDAVGVRKHGWTTPVTDRDLWHLGSNTKAMTATLVALLVQQGEIDWYQSIGETFPEVAGILHERYREARVIDLIRHRAGIPPQIPTQGYLRNPLYLDDLDVTRKRYELMLFALTGTPPVDPSLPFKSRYSNLGYAVLAAMLERVTGRSWETLMREELFGPLGMTSAGFGPPGDPWKGDERLYARQSPSIPEPDQPRGHQGSGAGRQAFYADITPVLAPAGGVHVSLADWAKFIRLHLNGEEGGLKLDSTSLLQLHAPMDGYAGGWGVSADQKTLSHNGSNTYWYARVVVHLDQGFAILVVTNLGTPSPTAAMGEVVKELRDYYLN